MFKKNWCQNLRVRSIRQKILTNIDSETIDSEPNHCKLFPIESDLRRANICSTGSSMEQFSYNIMIIVL